MFERCSVRSTSGRTSRWTTSWFALFIVVVLGACASSSEDHSETLTQVRGVALVPSLGEIVTALGAHGHLVGRTDFDTDPRLMTLPSVGGGIDPSLEQIVALGANVVLVAEGRDSPALTVRLSELGVESRAFPTQTIDDMRQTIQSLGVLFSAEAEADSLVASINAGLAEVRAAVAGRTPVPLMYVVWSDPPMTASTGTFIDEIITISGGANVFANAATGWPSVSFESIVDRVPHIVVWPQGEITVENEEVLRSTPGWRDVAAVQAGRVILVDGDSFNRPGPRVVDAARALARALHPDAFPQ